MKIVSIIGARPQFIKAAVVSRALRQNHTEIMIHTGQHYDANMSSVFIEDLGLSEPEVNLGIGSGSHGAQTGKMLIGIEKVLLTEQPDWVLVYGDTNSTLAGALAAVKLNIPVAHVEAGLRSFNREMPEEHNRVLTDHCSDLLFCPTQTAVDNLTREGINRGVHLVGDTMYDAVLEFSEVAQRRSSILQDLKVDPKRYFLATIHRPYNTDKPERLKSIISALLKLNEPVIFPVHPRTRKKIAKLEGISGLLSLHSNLHLIEPVGYLEMLVLEQNARMILTDSGGIQKEAYFFGVPCITLRPETEWVETVQAGWNILAGKELEYIVRAVRTFIPPASRPMLFGDGQAAARCMALMNNESSLM